MTSNQIKAYEVSVRNKELEEQKRANLVNEAMKNRENLAKYGSTDYATSEGQMSNGSWTALKAGKDIFHMFFDPVAQILGGKKK